MKKRLFSLLVLLCLLLAACGPAAQPEPDPAPELSQREKDWIEDIEFLREFSVDAYYDENGKFYEWEYTILPDVYVHQDIEDIRQGRDSVLLWVLTQEK